MIKKKGFLTQIKEERERQLKQKELKKKHGIDNENVIVVEKSNLIKFFVGLIYGLFRTVIYIILFLLAFVGLICLIYPAPRNELFSLFNELWKQLITMFSSLLLL